MTSAIETLLASRKVLATVEAADEIGLFDLLADAPASAELLCRTLGVDAESFGLLLRILQWNGVLEQSAAEWRLSDTYSTPLDPNEDDSVLHLLRIEGWAADDHLNRHGIVAALHGEHRPSEIPLVHLDALARAMLVGSRSSAPHVARLPELRSRRHLADIGGGSGGYAVLLCRLHRQLSVTVYDRIEMLQHADRVVAASELGDRVFTEPFDLHSSRLPTGHDAALISHVLHLLPRAERADLLARVRSGLGADGVLVVQDFIYDDPQQGSAAAARAVDWLAYGTGFAPSSTSLATELVDAGFVVDRVVRRHGGLGLVVASPS